jgi:hypothetical protein
LGQVPDPKTLKITGQIPAEDDSIYYDNASKHIHLQWRREEPTVIDPQSYRRHHHLLGGAPEQASQTGRDVLRRSPDTNEGSQSTPAPTPSNRGGLWPRPASQSPSPWTAPPFRF